MSKTQNQNTEDQPRSILLKDILVNVENTENEFYANHSQITLSTDEMILDFYKITPDPGRDMPHTKHIARFTLPITHGKGLSTAIANVIASYEEQTGTTLPNRREKEHTDKIIIWK